LHRRIVCQFVAELLCQITDGFLKHIADPFEEEQREDVAAKLGVIDIATQDVGRFFEKGIQLRLGHSAERDGNGSLCLAVLELLYTVHSHFWGDRRTKRCIRPRVGDFHQYLDLRSERVILVRLQLQYSCSQPVTGPRVQLE